MPNDPCPGADDLRRLLRGELSEADAAPLERHLLECLRCGERATTFEADDRGCCARAATAADPDAVGKLVERLARLTLGSCWEDSVTLTSEGGPGMASPPALPGYELLGELGRGGMGVVYKARQLGLNRVVALKMILAGEHAGEDSVSRFRTEAEALGRLHHPHIVQVHEIGQAEGRPFLCLEFCAGGSLAARLRQGPLPATEAAALLARVADAVHAAHEAGIVHRDLKPENILLAFSDASQKRFREERFCEASLNDCVPKVSDFGLAKRLDAADGRTRSGDLLGTPCYMAPEQAAGRLEDVGPTSDVHALGAILYECLTGRPPFKGASLADTLELVRSADPVPPRRLQPKLPRDLETICLKCLHKEPHKRYTTAGQLADDLERWLGGEPIRARPVGWVERTMRWLRRRPMAAAFLAVSVLASVLLLGLGFWFSARLGASHGALEAEAARAEASRERAEWNEFFSLVSNVRERGARPQPGWTWAVLADLDRTARMGPAADHLPQLRSEAALALGSIDVRPLGPVARGFNADCLAFSADGRLLALGEAKALLAGSIRLLDEGGRGRSRSLSFPSSPIPHRKHGTVLDGVRSLVFSPEGRWLVAGARGGRLHRWDLKQDPPSLVSWPAHGFGVTYLAFSSDGSALYSASLEDRTVKRWTCAGWPGDRGVPRAAACWTAPEGIDGLAVHPSEGWLACSTEENKLHFLAADTLKPLRGPLGRPGPHVQLSPRGDSYAFTRGGELHLGSLHDDRWRRSLRIPDSDRAEVHNLSELVFSPDGGLLLTSSQEGRHVKLWEVAGGRLLADLVVGGGTARAVFAPDGRTFAVAADRRTLLYEIRRPPALTRGAGQQQPILGCALHPDGRRLACLSRSVWDADWRDVTVWPLAGPPALRAAARDSFRETGRIGDYCLGFQPRTRILAHTGGEALTFRDAFDLAGARVLPEHEEVSLCFAPDGRLWEADGGEVRLWDREMTTVLARWSDKLDVSGLSTVYCVAAGRRLVAAGSRNGSVYLLRGDASLASSARIGGAVRSVALGTDETLVAAGTDQGHLCLLRVPGGAVVAEARPHADRVAAVAFAGSGLLASGSHDRTVKLWDCTAGKLRELLTLRQPAPVRWLTFHPDGVRLFVLLDREREVRVWHLDRLRRRLAELHLADDMPALEPVPLAPPAPPLPPPAAPLTVPPRGPHGLRAELFAGMELGRCLKILYDEDINIAWSQVPLDPLLAGKRCSVRWTGWLKPPRPGRYRLRLSSAGGGRLWLDGRLRLDGWQSRTSYHEVEVELSDRPHALRVEYFNRPDGTGVGLGWTQVGGFPFRPVPSSALFHDRAAAEKATTP